MELNGSVEVVNNVSVAEGGKVKTEAINKLRHLVLIVFVLDVLIAAHKSILQCVEVDHCVGQDAEFLAGPGVEGHVAELVEAEWQFSVWDSQELLGFQVVDRKSKIRHSANYHKILSVATEGHRAAAKSCLHLDLGDDPLTRHLVNVALGLQAVFTCGDKAKVGSSAYLGISVLSNRPNLNQW